MSQRSASRALAPSRSTRTSAWPESAADQRVAAPCREHRAGIDDHVAGEMTGVHQTFGASKPSPGR